MNNSKFLNLLITRLHDILRGISAFLIVQRLAACGGAGSAGTGQATLGHGDHDSPAPTSAPCLVGDS